MTDRRAPGSQTPPLLGCVADDFTGATDLAGTLVAQGMRTVQMIGVPAVAPPPDVDAVVVALKSRTIEASAAVAQSLAALRWLQGAGCSRFFFKYCSTFDSTDAGNIGPVADALLAGVGGAFTIACPAFPDNGRTVFRGHLFVGDVLLSESGMRDHPLTPMTDPNLVRVLQRQTRRRVGLVRYDDVAAGPERIRARFSELQAAAVEIAVVDAVSNPDFAAIGAACLDLPLVTAGSGLAIGLVPAFRRAGLLLERRDVAALPTARGARAVVAGSCSAATLDQLEAARAAGLPAFHVDPQRLAAGDDVVGAVAQWAAPLLSDRPIVVYASAPPERVRAAQERLGRDEAGRLVESALAAVAQRLVDLGVGQLIVAGGETAGAVVSALGIQGLRIGPQIDPGVPWTSAIGGRPVSLALKSGNFGRRTFFVDAWEVLP